MAENPTIRKFIDLIRQTSGKWTNWDPPIPVAVGDYGKLNMNGELIVEGNIYHPSFQEHLDEIGFKLDLKANPPELGNSEQDYIVASTGVKKGELKVDQNVNIPGIASASIKGTWRFQNRRRGALIILHMPRQRFIPKFVQTKILDIKALEGKKVVMSALHVLPISYGGEVSVALCARVAASDVANGEIGGGWWTNNESALLRRGCNAKGEPCFIPLFSLGERFKRSSLFSWLPRGEGETGPSSDEDEYVWKEVYQPWKPLDEDGNEVDD